MTWLSELQIPTREESPIDWSDGFSPGELRAVAWVAERHPDTTIRIAHVRDRADVGWLVARAGGVRAPFDYWCSSTGRVFQGLPSWGGDTSTRTDTVLRDADYDRRR